MMILVSRTMFSGLKESDGAIHFILYLTMLNLSSVQSMKLVIILLTNIRNDLNFLHVLALVLINHQFLSSLHVGQIWVHYVSRHFTKTHFGP